MGLRVRSFVLLFAIASSFLPIEADAASSRKPIADALLLMISSHLSVENEDAQDALDYPSFRVKRADFSPAQSGTLSKNEIEYLREFYLEACLLEVERAKAHYTGQQECLEVAATEQKCANMRIWLNTQAEELAKARRRRARNRGLQGIARGFRRAIRKADIGQAFRWVAKEVIPEVAKAALTGGVAWKGQALRHFGRHVLRKKLTNELGYAVLRNQARQQAAAKQTNDSIAILTQGVKDAMLTEAELKAIQDQCNSAEEGRVERRDGCGTDGAWIDAYWENVVVTRLKEDFKHCSNTNPYRSCLEQQAAAGLCEDAAHEACKQIYDSLWSIPPGPITLGKENVTTPTRHIWESFDFEMTFDGRGGPVTGTHESVRVFNAETDPCTTTVNLEFSGTFSTSTCLMEGNATRTLSLSQPGSAGPCWSHGCDFGPEGCTYPDPWAMKVYDGRLNCVPNVGRYSVCSLEISLTPVK
jgi:hypothetical protein